MKKKILNYYREIDDLQISIDIKKIYYLESNGWERSCDFPGSYWLWVHKYKNKMVAVDEKMAITFQQHIDSKIYNWRG